MTDETKGHVTSVFLLALCIFREARGEEDKLSRYAVACAIRNRAKNPSWWGNGYIEVILAPYQFSSFNKNDPNVTVFPNPKRIAEYNVWRECLDIAAEVYEDKFDDITKGAQFYYAKSMDKAPPSWAAQYEHTCDYGSHHFYKGK